jgi:hypothetical protein
MFKQNKTGQRKAVSRESCWHCEMRKASPSFAIMFVGEWIQVSYVTRILWLYAKTSCTVCYLHKDKVNTLYTDREHASRIRRSVYWTLYSVLRKIRYTVCCFTVGNVTRISLEGRIYSPHRGAGQTQRRSFQNTSQIPSSLPCSSVLVTIPFMSTCSFSSLIQTQWVSSAYSVLRW